MRGTESTGLNKGQDTAPKEVTVSSETQTQEKAAVRVNVKRNLSSSIPLRARLENKIKF